MNEVSIQLDELKSIMNNINNILINNNNIIYEIKNKEIIDKLEVNNRELKLIQEKLMNFSLVDLESVLKYNDIKVNISNNTKIDFFYKEDVFNIVNELLLKNRYLKELNIDIIKSSNKIIISIKNIKTNINLDTKIKYNFENNKLNIYLEQNIFVIETLEICVGDVIYLLPIENMLESLQPNKDMLKIIGDGSKELLMLRDSFLPIIRLSKIFKLNNNHITDLTNGILIVVKNDKEKFCIFVDKFLQQTQSVIKPFSNDLMNLNCILGTSIRGNNEVSLVLDLNSIENIIKD